MQSIEYFHKLILKVLNVITSDLQISSLKFNECLTCAKYFVKFHRGKQINYRLTCFKALS